MLEITPHTNRAAHPALLSYRSGEEAGRPMQAAASAAESDRVEISDAARQFGAESTSSPQTARISDLRSQIASDSYLTNDKIDYVVERLYEELTGSKARSA